MKARVFAAALAIAAIFSCQKPEEEKSSINADKTSIDVALTGELVDISITSTGKVTVTNDNDWITVNEGVALGSTYPYSLDVAANEGAVARKGVILFSTEGAEAVSVTISQEGSGIIADWDLKALTDKSKQTFAKGEDACTVGFNGVFAEPSEGMGKIEYYCCEKESFFVGGKNFYAVGSNGDLYVNGTIEGDYWQITASSETDIPAGTKVEISFMTNFGDRCTKYWMLSLKEGDKTTPVFNVQKVTESAIRGLNTGKDTPIEYSKEIEYNFCAGIRSGISKSACKYERVVGTVTTSVASKDVVFTFGPTGHVTLSGPAWTGAPDCLIDKISTAGTKSPYEHVTRLSAQGSNNGDPSGTYDQHITVRIVK